jgi:hypothetical protein
MVWRRLFKRTAFKHSMNLQAKEVLYLAKRKPQEAIPSTCPKCKTVNYSTKHQYMWKCVKCRKWYFVV